MTTVAQAFDYYLAVAPVKKSTKNSVTGTKKKVVAAGLADVDVYKLTPAMVRQFCASLKLSPASVHVKYIHLTSCIRFFLREHSLPPRHELSGILRQPRILSGEEQIVEYLTLTQVKAILALDLGPAQPTDRLQKINRISTSRLLFVVMCFTGMAVSDVVKFDPALHVKGNWILYRRTKNGNPCKIPLLPIAKEIIDQLKWPPRLAIRTIQEHCTILGEKFGVPLNPHKARHTFGCVMLEIGFSMDSVRSMMGHSSIKTTERIYAKVTEEKIQREMDAMTERNKKEIA